MKHIDALIADGGTITIGPVDSIECVATAADQHNCLAMLVRRDGETITALLKRLNKAIGAAMDGGDIIDEVND